MSSLYRILVCCLLLVCFQAFPAFAGKLFSVSDPRGDDHGGGKIVYPQRNDFNKGDLDLTEFSAESDDKGTWFEARFANPVRSPKGVMSRFSPTPLTSFIHQDFYTSSGCRYQSA